MSRALTIKQRRELEAREQQLASQKRPHNCDWVVADISLSMNWAAFEDKRRITCLRDALRPLAGRVQVLAFNNTTQFVQADEIPDAGGGTDLAGALRTMHELEPLHILVVSDGEPNNKPDALTEATKLSDQCVIDVLYIGPQETAAEEFMQALARAGRGRYSKFDINKQSPLLLGNKVSDMLALPAPTTVVL